MGRTDLKQEGVGAISCPALTESTQNHVEAHSQVDSTKASINIKTYVGIDIIDI